MKTFIILVLTTIAITFLAVTNTTPVPLHFYSFTMSFPLPFILVFPTGISLLCFAFFYERQKGKTTIIIRGLEDDLQNEQIKIMEIIKHTHELEIENEKLKVRLGDTDSDEDSL